MRDRWVALLALITVVVAGSVGGVAASDYDITVPDAVDTPSKTVEIKGSSFPVDGIAERDPGSDITAEVTRPTDEGYRMYIYGTNNGNQEIVDSKFQTADSVTFELPANAYPPGTYTFTLHTDGDYQAVFPFVVSGVSIDVSAPDQVEPGDAVTISGTVTEEADSVAPTEVRVALLKDDSYERTTTELEDGSFETSLSTEKLPEGTYSVYVAVENDSTTATGDPELIGMDASESIRIGDEESIGDTPQQPTSTEESPSTSQATTSASSTSATTTTTDVVTTTQSSTTTKTDTTTSSTTATTETTTSSNGGVITPRSPTSETTSTTTPLRFTPGIMALLLFGVIMRLRDR